MRSTETNEENTSDALLSQALVKVGGILPRAAPLLGMSYSGPCLHY